MNQEETNAKPRTNRFLPSRPQKRTRISSLAFASSLALITGCVVGTESEGHPESSNTESHESSDENPGNNQPIASTVTSSTEIGNQLQIDIQALEAVDNGLLRLQLSITNNSESSFRISQGLSDSDNPYTANKVTLIDSVNQKRYLSYRQSDGSCFCLPFEGPIKSGETVDTWVIFPEAPPEVESMTITTPLTPPLLDIPISNSTESIENPGLQDPEILDLTMISDDLEEQTGRSESGEEVSIILSSDVLFETNSSDLSNESQEILEQVATEIDEATSEVVNIDGYADNTGNDSVNIPLSLERAESVESQLNSLLQREDIAFKSDGHGSADPIAENDTEEGRERNRRVTVTFAK